VTTTTIEYNDGHTITRIGTAGLTVTSTRVGSDVNVQMEFDFTTQEECMALVGTLLFQLDELYGENLVTQCFAHYADEAGKPLHRLPGKRDRYIIRGHKDGRR
jgi:hypothetical protein